MVRATSAEGTPDRPDRLAGPGPLFLVEGDVFRWLLFFVLILAAILAFVSFVMGIDIPGLSQFGIQQPSSPFQP